MCGRYASTQTDDELLEVFGAYEAVGDSLPPSYNVAPTDPVRVVLERVPRDARPAEIGPMGAATAASTPISPISAGEPGKAGKSGEEGEGGGPGATDAAPVRQVRTARWGLIPSWAKDAKIGARLINARMETITEKPSFKAAAQRRRCLLPAAGYYEWEKRDGRKVPQFLHGDGVLALAGLYELWPDPTKERDDPGRWVLSVTVLTTTASDRLGHIHDRSPVVVPAPLWDDWLDPARTDPARVQELLTAMPEPRLQPYEVSSAVNSVRNNGPELLRPV